jgi:hypothetical protein
MSVRWTHITIPVTDIDGSIDHGGSVGYIALVREPSGHLVEFTHGQPLKGLPPRKSASA